jgi:hypothetical protein
MNFLICWYHYDFYCHVNFISIKRTSCKFIFIFSLISIILLVKVSRNEGTLNKVISAEQAEDLRQKQKRRREREVCVISIC